MHLSIWSFEKRMPTKPHRLMGLLMTNELASFRLWTMIYLLVRIPVVVTRPWPNHPWESSFLIRGDDNDKLKHDKRLIIIWGHHEVWPQEEVPQSEQEPGCWSKTESGCGRYIPVFSDASSNISSQPYNQVLCYVQQISLYRLLLPISTHVSAFLGPFLFAPDNMRTKTGFLGLFLKVVLGFEVLKHTTFCQNCAMHCMVRSSLTLSWIITQTLPGRFRWELGIMVE